MSTPVNVVFAEGRWTTTDRSGLKRRSTPEEIELAQKIARWRAVAARRLRRIEQEPEMNKHVRETEKRRSVRAAARWFHSLPGFARAFLRTCSPLSFGVWTDKNLWPAERPAGIDPTQRTDGEGE